MTYGYGPYGHYPYGHSSGILGMRTKKIIKRFIFEEKNRSKITLDSNSRLNPQKHYIQLKADANDEYPTTSDITVSTWVTNPLSLKSWAGFDVYANLPTNIITKNEPTSLGFKLGNGTDQFYWNGSVWEANTTNWNTEAEVSTNISSFSVASQKLQIFINLVTTDSSYTPTVSEIRLIFESTVEFQEDIFIKSFIPMLRENIRPIGVYPIKIISTTNTIDLNAYPLQTPYNVVGIDSVYNHTTDSNHFNDLFVSYDENTKIITLNTDILVGQTAWVNFYWEPEVAFTTSEDYSEIDKVPAMHITGLNPTNEMTIGQGTYVRDKTTNIAIGVEEPKQIDLELTIRGLTASSRDQQRLADEIRRFFSNNTKVISKAMDEEYDLDLIDDYEIESTTGRSSIHNGVFRCRIAKVLYYYENTKTTNVVSNFKISGNVNVEI